MGSLTVFLNSFRQVGKINATFVGLKIIWKLANCKI